MSNRTQMRTRLREELGATTANEIWTDDHLDDLLIEASDWYSRLFPSKSTVSRDVAADQRTYSLPAGWIAVQGVECPPGNRLPEEGEPVSVDPTPYTGSYRQSWSVWGDTLYLRNKAAGDEVGLGKMYIWVLVLWNRPDPVEDWNGPHDAERLLILWAACEAWAWLDGEDQRLGRSTRAGFEESRYRRQLEREVNERRGRARSRTLVSA